MSIEGFRNLNQEIETIINKSEAVKKARKEANDEALSDTEKKELSKEEKEYKSLRKQIQENSSSLQREFRFSCILLTSERGR